MIIVDPDDYDPREATDQAIALADEFIALNQLPSVTYSPNPFGRWHGYYQSGGYVPLIFYNPRRCVAPVKTPGYQRSYTGYKADLTIPGVIAHELGHHMHFAHALGRVTIARAWKQIRDVEAGITSYGDTCTGEDIAESVKLFVLNPDLLRVGRPKRWQYLTGVMGMRPIEVKPWWEILCFAHEKIIDAAYNWIKHGGGNDD